MSPNPTRAWEIMKVACFRVCARLVFRRAEHGGCVYNLAMRGKDADICWNNEGISLRTS
jgi:hypothetical protein